MTLGTPADALVLDTRPLHRQPGASLRLVVTVEAGPDLRNDVIAVPGGTGLRAELLLESVLDGILVTGSVDVPMVGTCVRCLDPLTRRQSIRFRQFFAYPGVEIGDPDGSEDVEVMNGPLIDVRPAFRDALLLALPLSPTCRPDCPGLCPECGFRLADDPSHQHEHADPRWAGLSRWQAADEGE